MQTEIAADGAPKGAGLEAFSPGRPDEAPTDDVRQHTVDSDANSLDVALEQRVAELRAREERAAKQAQELHGLFSEEIADGRLLIRQDSTDVVIQILEKDSFASGSANLEPSSHETLAKVGGLVASLSGAITVWGHTDNVPVRPGGPYRSNWDLSAARAASVAHELLDAGVDPARVMVSGHANTQPRAANDTPANRALNRRVDITFINGKERHGRWAEAGGGSTLAALEGKARSGASRCGSARGPRSDRQSRSSGNRITLALPARTTAQ